MGADLPALASVFLNSFCWLLSGSLCGYLFFRGLFAARHVPVLLWGYFLVRVLLVATWDTWTWAGVGIFGALQKAVIALLLVAMLLVLYHTWEGTLAQLALMGLLADTMGMLAGVFAMALVNAARGLGPAMAYIGPWGAHTLAMSGLYIGGFLLLCKASVPLCRRLLAFVGHYDRVASPAAVVFSIALASSQAIGVDGDFSSNIEVAFSIAIVYVPFAAILLGLNLWRARRTRLRLLRSRRLLAAYGDVLESQAASLAEGRAILDAISRRIDRLDEGMARDDMRAYLADLRTACDRLRFGTYSDKPVLDAVLISFEGRFREMGVPLRCRISPFAAEGDDVAFAVQALLEWAHARLAGQGSLPAHADAGEVALRVFRRADQLLVELRVPERRRGLPFRLRFARHLPAACRVVAEGVRDGAHTVRLLVGVGPR